MRVDPRPVLRRLRTWAIAKGSRTWIFVLLVVTVLVVFGALWIYLPAWDFLVRPVAPSTRGAIADAIESATDPADRADLQLQIADLEQQDAARRNGLRAGIATLAAASIAALGAVNAYRQMQDNRQQANKVRKETAEQLGLTRDAQLTERFTRAVDQLGSDNLDVRIGGIYALERISVDSSPDLPTVVEILAAFVRGHSHPPSSTHSESMQAGHQQSYAAADRVPVDLGGEALSRRATDVQAALTVLGRSKREPLGTSIDLSSTNLEYANLTSARLEHSFLSGAHLEHATLIDVHLEHAIAQEVHFEWARLEWADLRWAHLEWARFEHANLNRARLDCAFLTGAHFEHANLRGAHLEHAIVHGAYFEAARADHDTTWPEGFDPQAAGVVLDDRDESTDREQEM